MSWDVAWNTGIAIGKVVLGAGGLVLGSWLIHQGWEEAAHAHGQRAPWE